MKRIALVATVLAFGLVPAHSPAAQDTGIELQKECQSVFAPERTHDDFIKGAHCLGYISGVVFTVEIWEGNNRDKHLGVRDVPACLPDNGTNEEYAKVVLHYLDEHPNQLHMNYGLLLLFALKDAYPCH